MIERARHRFRWRACSSSARHRLRRNRLRGLGGAGRTAHGGGRARRGAVDGVPHPGVSCVRRAAPTPACMPRARSPTSTCPPRRCSHAYPRTTRAGAGSDVAAKRLRSFCRWCGDSHGFCPPMCACSTSAVPQRVSTRGSRRCAGITPIGCRPRRTASNRRRRASSRRGRARWTSTRWRRHHESCWGCTTSPHSVAIATAPPPSAICSGWTGPATATASPPRHRRRVLLGDGAVVGGRAAGRRRAPP